ncbi:MAG TPA: hypothetical protein PLV62_09280 [Spirochaetota bacterium]|nr:hypothetical protein [Spirochaetota bacterium]HPK45158.1 hypothetical protein [Spirochaetota bacterium]
MPGQPGFLWSLWILKKYGSKREPASFYAQKYLTAFPIFINQQNNINFVDACYTVCFVAGNNNDNSSLF